MFLWEQRTTTSPDFRQDRNFESNINQSQTIRQWLSGKSTRVESGTIRPTRWPLIECVSASVVTYWNRPYGKGHNWEKAVNVDITRRNVWVSARSVFLITSIPHLTHKIWYSDTHNLIHPKGYLRNGFKSVHTHIEQMFYRETRFF